MKKIYFLLLVIGCNFSAYSQRLHMGVSTSVLKTYLLDRGIRNDPRYAPMTSKKWSPVGATIAFEANSGYGIVTEFYLSNLSRTYQMLDAYKNQIGKRQIDLKYWNLPILIKRVGNNSGKARYNWGGGPQFSFLQKGIETIRQEADSATVIIPQGQIPPPGAIRNPDGTYTVFKAENVYNSFARRDVAIALTGGIDIDVYKRFLVTVNMRLVYGISDVRSDDLIKQLINKQMTLASLAERRANLYWGTQFGIHYFLSW